MGTKHTGLKGENEAHTGPHHEHKAHKTKAQKPKHDRHADNRPNSHAIHSIALPCLPHCIHTRTWQAPKTPSLLASSAVYVVHVRFQKSKRKRRKKFILQVAARWSVDPPAPPIRRHASSRHGHGRADRDAPYASHPRRRLGLGRQRQPEVFYSDMMVREEGKLGTIPVLRLYFGSAWTIASLRPMWRQGERPAASALGPLGHCKAVLLHTLATVLAVPVLQPAEGPRGQWWGLSLGIGCRL